MSIINLLPEEYIERRQRRRANLLCLVLFGVVMAGVLTAGLVSERSRMHTEAVRRRVEDSYAEAAKLIAQMQDLEHRKRTMLRKAELTSALLERIPRSYLLAVVTNALPPEATLRDVKLVRKKVITRAERGRKAKSQEDLTMTVTGLAATDVEVARFIAHLARNPLSSAVDLVYSEEEQIKEHDTVMREFQVEIVLRTDVDVIDILHDTRPEPAEPRELARADTEVTP